MQGCFTWLLLMAGGVFVMMSLLRWFEQTTEAVEQGWWNKVIVLVVFPFAVWFYPSRVGAGRPTPVPHHEPVRGFGSVPKAKAKSEPVVPAAANEALAATDSVERAATPRAEGPPPGTPKEFIGMAVVPPKAKKSQPAVDSDKVARLRQKMREQGMLPPGGDGDA
jgi:hypothetical protein